MRLDSASHWSLVVGAWITGDIYNSEAIVYCLINSRSSRHDNYVCMYRVYSLTTYSQCDNHVESWTTGIETIGPSREAGEKLDRHCAGNSYAIICIINYMYWHISINILHVFADSCSTDIFILLLSVLLMYRDVHARHTCVLFTLHVHVHV